MTSCTLKHNVQVVQNMGVSLPFLDQIQGFKKVFTHINLHQYPNYKMRSTYVRKLSSTIIVFPNKSPIARTIDLDQNSIYKLGNFTQTRVLPLKLFVWLNKGVQSFKDINALSRNHDPFKITLASSLERKMNPN